MSNVSSTNTLPTDEQTISCEQCLDSIPISESEIPEAEDYVVYFCGLDCYDIWKHQSTKDNAA